MEDRRETITFGDWNEPEDSVLYQARDNLDTIIERLSSELLRSQPTITPQDLTNLARAMYDLVSAREQIRFIDGT